MVTLAERVAALPTFEELQARGVPGRSRLLTPEERNAVVKRPSPRRYGGKAEQWLKSRLERAGATLYKNVDALCTGRDKRTGETYHFRQKSKFVDFSGTIPLVIRGEPHIVTVQIEVKAFQKAFALNGLKQHQQNILLAAKKRGELPLVALVLHEQGKIQQGWLFIYRATGAPKGNLSQNIPDWADLLAVINDNAVTDKRFGGKSARLKDLAEFEQCTTKKVKGRWQTFPWLADLLPQKSPEMW